MRRLGPVAAVTLAVSVIVACRPALASASAHLVYLRGPGAEQCAGEQALRAAVSARLGYDPFFAWAHETLFAEIQHADGGFRAVVKLVDENNLQRGAREISVEGDDCSAVIDAMGLTISLTIDPSSIIGPAGETPASLHPAPEPSVDVTGVTPRRAPAPSEATVPPRWRALALSLHAGAGLVGSVNAAPSPTAGATVFIGLSWRALSLDVEGRADYPTTGDGDVPAVGRVRSWLFAGSIVPCIHIGPAFGCVVAGAGTLGASAQNVSHPAEKYGPWSAVGGRLGVEWAPFGPPLSLRASAELLGVLTRDTLYVDNTPVYPVPPWSADVALAAAWRFR